MPSERPEEPHFFVDRSLGRKRVPDRLRQAGLRVRTLAEVYGVPADEDVADVDWLRADEMADLCLAHIERIVASCADPGPFLYVVTRRGLRRVDL